jgi:cell wall assembly regulator SMI1
MSTIESILSELEAEIRRQGFEIDLAPYSREDIARIEAAFGRPLPQAVRAFFARSRLSIYQSSYGMLSAEQIIETWQSMTALLEQGAFDDGRVEEFAWRYDDQARIRRVWWSRGWLPFCEDGCGNMKCFDLDPSPQGTVGQILHMERQPGDEGPRYARFASITEFLERALVGARQGAFCEDGGETFSGVDFTEIVDEAKAHADAAKAPTLELARAGRDLDEWVADLRALAAKAKGAGPLRAALVDAIADRARTPPERAAAAVALAATGADGLAPVRAAMQQTAVAKLRAAFEAAVGKDDGALRAALLALG